MTVYAALHSEDIEGLGELRFEESMDDDMTAEETWQEASSSRGTGIGSRGGPMQ